MCAPDHQCLPLTGISVTRVLWTGRSPPFDPNASDGDAGSGRPVWLASDGGRVGSNTYDRCIHRITTH
jgi:hypothetical protein